MRKLFLLPLMILSFNLHATTCSDVEGFHKIQSQEGEFYLGLYMDGQVELSIKEGFHGFFINEHQAGAVKGRKTVVPLTWAPLYLAKDGVSSVREVFAQSQTFRSIQPFNKDEHPRFYRSISKKFLNTLNELEVDETDQLILDCAQIRIQNLQNN